MTVKKYKFIQKGGGFNFGNNYKSVLKKNPKEILNTFNNLLKKYGYPNYFETKKYKEHKSISEVKKLLKELYKYLKQSIIDKCKKKSDSKNINYNNINSIKTQLLTKYHEFLSAKRTTNSQKAETERTERTQQHTQTQSNLSDYNTVINNTNSRLRHINYVTHQLDDTTSLFSRLDSNIIGPQYRNVYITQLHQNPILLLTNLFNNINAFTADLVNMDTTIFPEYSEYIINPVMNEITDLKNTVTELKTKIETQNNNKLSEEQILVLLQDIEELKTAKTQSEKSIKEITTKLEAQTGELTAQKEHYEQEIEKLKKNLEKLSESKNLSLYLIKVSKTDDIKSKYLYLIKVSKTDDIKSKYLYLIEVSKTSSEA